ncbi:SWA protein [Acrasis kona]|uniref:SWA protein n=1 Tax=Acrasis kona TaxID=1008807 RepID=A0AAW2ZHW4_9EUKA
MSLTPGTTFSIAGGINEANIIKGASSGLVIQGSHFPNRRLLDTNESSLRPFTGKAVIKDEGIEVQVIYTSSFKVPDANLLIQYLATKNIRATNVVSSVLVELRTGFTIINLSMPPLQYQPVVIPRNQTVSRRLAQENISLKTEVTVLKVEVKRLKEEKESIEEKLIRAKEELIRAKEENERCRREVIELKAKYYNTQAMLDAMLSNDDEQ